MTYCARLEDSNVLVSTAPRHDQIFDIKYRLEHFCEMCENIKSIYGGHVNLVLL